MSFACAGVQSSCLALRVAEFRHVSRTQHFVSLQKSGIIWLKNKIPFYTPADIYPACDFEEF